MHRPHQCLYVILLTVIAVTLSACAFQPKPPTPAPLPAITSTDLNGHPHDPLAAKDRKATVLLFITNDCPISNGYAPEIHRLCDTYIKQGIEFYLVYSDASLSLANSRQHYKDYAYKCPAVFDPKHQLAIRAGATVTPEAAVFLSDGKLVYRGRINDLYVDFGRPRFLPTINDLKNVLEAIAKDQPVTFRSTEAIGCLIPM